MRKRVTHVAPYTPNVEKVYYEDGSVGYRGTGVNMPTPAEGQPPPQSASGNYEEPASQEELDMMSAISGNHGLNPIAAYNAPTNDLVQKMTRAYDNSPLKQKSPQEMADIIKDAPNHRYYDEAGDEFNLDDKENNENMLMPKAIDMQKLRE